MTRIHLQDWLGRTPSTRLCQHSLTFGTASGSVSQEFANQTSYLRGRVVVHRMGCACDDCQSTEGQSMLTG
jgi:hypothetical protein